MNLVTEILLKLSKESVLNTGEPCTCKYVTLLQSFHRMTLSIHTFPCLRFVESILTLPFLQS